MTKKLKIYILMVIQLALLIGGSVLIAKPMYHLLKRQYVGWNAERRWQHALDGKGNGKEAAWLCVDQTDINTLVMKSDKKEDLYQFPIFGRETDNLSIIMAHRDIHFRQLGSIKLGNEIKLTFSDKTKCSYEAVDFEIIKPDEVSTRLNSKEKEKWLVLMTCYPFYYIGPAPKRYLVWCRPKKACL